MARSCPFQSAESLTTREGFPGNWQNERHFHLDHQRTSLSIPHHSHLCLSLPLPTPQSISVISVTCPGFRGSVVGFWLWLCWAVLLVLTLDFFFFHANFLPLFLNHNVF